MVTLAKSMMKLRGAAVMALAALVPGGPSGAGEAEAPSLIAKAGVALVRKDGRAIVRLVSSDRVATFEAVERLLTGAETGSPELPNALARVYAEVYHDDFLLERTATFRAWSPLQRAARDDAFRLKEASRDASREGRLVEAQDGLERALRVFREVKDVREEARCLASLGATVALKGESQAALDWLDKASTASRISGDLVLQTTIELNRSYALEDLGETARARAAIQIALPIARTTGDREGEASLLLNLCSLTLNDADFREANASALAAVRIGDEIGDDAVCWAAWMNLAIIYSHEGDLERAGRSLRRAVGHARHGGLPVEEASAGFNLANNARRRGDLRGARRWLARARQAAAPSDSGTIKCKIEIAEAVFLMEEGRYAETLPFIDAAEAKLGGARVPAILSEFHQTRALAHFYLGNYERAVSWTRSALENAMAASRRDMEAYCRSNLGRLLSVVGERTAGLAELEKGARLYEAVGDRVGHANTLDAIGALRFHAGDLTGARSALEQAVSSLGQDSRRERAEAMTDLAALELASGPGRRAIAMDLLRQAADSSEALEDLHGTSLASLVEAEAFLHAHDLPSARSALARIGRVARGRKNAEFDWHLDYTEGLLAQAEGNDQEALRRFRRAVGEVEALRSRVQPLSWRAAILEDRIEPYRALARLHRQRGEIEEAYLIARSAKARTFTERLSPTDYDASFVARQPPPHDLLPATVVPAGRLQELIGPNEVLLDFFFDGDELLVFVVRRGGINLKSLPSAGLSELLETLRYPGRPGPSEVAVAESWRRACVRAGEMLLRPVASGLGSFDHLLIVPNGPLHGVPFAALELDGRRLVDRWDLSILPAAESLFSRRRVASTKPGSTLSMGDPAGDHPAGRLPHAVQEARLVASMADAGGEVVIGNAAREATFRREAPRFARIHLAAHGRIDSVAPAHSYIDLAPGDGEDGHLEAAEIASMKIGASIVVLSGCETGVEGGIAGGDPPGDERTGLARAFLAAGAGSVVAGLWETEDRASSRIMPELYPRLRGRSAAAALAQLQRDILAGKIKDADGRPLDHPFYWAGLVAYGAGGGGSHDRPASRPGR